MHAICGYFHLNAKPAARSDLAGLSAALVPNATQDQHRFASVVTDQLALGTASWGGHARKTAGSPIYRDGPSGCIAVVDARLDGQASLAASLKVRRPAGASSQAELILRSYLQWGERCPEHLSGDFAFAVWDPRAQHLFCARDIMGVRPLYVHYQPGKLFAFASRAKALLTLRDVPLDLNEGRIADTLVPELESIDKRCTFYTAVQRLPPAHCISIHPDRCRERRYWCLRPGQVDVPATNDDWARALTEVLERSVSRHLESDCKVGSMLSGGLDSSSLVAIAADQLAALGKAPLETFSCISSDPECRETRAIRSMLRLPSLSPSVTGIELGATDWQALTDAEWQSDEPFDCGMLLVRAQYLAASRRGVGALMDGIDGDTIFASGPSLIRQLRKLQWLDVWGNLRGFRRLYPDDSTWRELAGLGRAAFTPDFLRRIRRRNQTSNAACTAVASTLIAEEFAQQADLGDRLKQLKAWQPTQVLTDASAQNVWSLMHPNTVCGLERYHRVAAWYGVEPRHPFTDHEVIEFCVNLPDRQRLARGFSKAVLRHAMRNRLPADVCWRSDKSHLGWSLIQRHLLGSSASLRRRLEPLFPLLKPYVNLGRVDIALAHYGEPGHHWSDVALFSALALGEWLQRHRPEVVRGRPV